jgi:hypothetical protein
LSIWKNVQRFPEKKAEIGYFAEIPALTSVGARPNYLNLKLSKSQKKNGWGFQPF